MSTRKKLSIVRNALIFTVIAWFLITFMIVPVINVVKTTFFTNGKFSSYNYVVVYIDLSPEVCYTVWDAVDW